MTNVYLKIHLISLKIGTPGSSVYHTGGPIGTGVGQTGGSPQGINIPGTVSTPGGGVIPGTRISGQGPYPGSVGGVVQSGPNAGIYPGSVGSGTNIGMYPSGTGSNIPANLIQPNQPGVIYPGTTTAGGSGTHPGMKVYTYPYICKYTCLNLQKLKYFVTLVLQVI